MKQKLKEIAKLIRKLRPEMKDYQRENCGSQGSLGWELERARYEFRHKHVVYCLLRGRTMEQIERVCHNPPNQTYIDKLLEEAREEVVDETLCACAV